MLRFFLLVAGVMTACAGFTESASPCSAEALPIKINTPGYGSRITSSISEISGSLPHFRAFVTAVTEHIADQMNKKNICLGSVEIQRRSLVKFVNWPAQVASPPHLERINELVSSSGGCRIFSPWIDLVFEQKKVPPRPNLANPATWIERFSKPQAPWVRAVVRWNVRQMLADQAMLAGMKNVPSDVVMPLTYREFGHFVGEYADTVFHHEAYTDKRPFETLEERVSPDVLWALRRAWQSTLMPFNGSVHSALGSTTIKSAEGYTKLVIALIDRCFDSDGATLHYSNILDTADLISLEEYRIDRLND